MTIDLHEAHNFVGNIGRDFSRVGTAMAGLGKRFELGALLACHKMTRSQHIALLTGAVEELDDLADVMLEWFTVVGMTSAAIREFKARITNLSARFALKASQIQIDQIEYGDDGYEPTTDQEIIDIISDMFGGAEVTIVPFRLDESDS